MTRAVRFMNKHLQHLHKKRTFFKGLILMIVIFISMQFLILRIAAIDSEKSELRVVIDKNYPPYSFMNERGELQGISIDLWNLFSKKTGIPVKIDGLDWNLAQEEMKRGKADVIDMLFFNSERDKIFDFSPPYADIEVTIFFDRRIGGIVDVSSLEGFEIAVKDGDNSLSFLRDHGITNIKVFNNYESIIEAASKNEINIFVIDKPPALYYLYKYGIHEEFNYTESLYKGEFHRAVQQDDHELLQVINTGFAKINSIEKLRINEEWFGRTQTSLGLVLYVPYVILVSGFIGLLLLVWNWSLRKKVAQKTRELNDNYRKLATREDHIRGILEAIPDLYFVISKDGIFLEFHGSQTESLYAEPSYFIGKHIGDIFPEELTARFMQSVERLIATGQTQSMDYRLEWDGSYHYFESRMTKAGISTVVAIIRDITERKNAEITMQIMSTHDTLTGLKNRNYFEEMMVFYQEKNVSQLGVVMCDLDGLKLVNDALGHDQGDLYLKVVAEQIQKSFPPAAIVARIGGDEYGVLIADVGEDLFTAILSALIDELPEFLSNSIKMPVSISIGSVYYTREQENQRINVVDLLMESDRRMYREKIHRKQSIHHEMIQTLRKMLEVRDFITEGHAERMEDLVVRLSEVMKVPHRSLSDMRLFAQFHDIGKIGIPDSILFKKGKLDDEEFLQMKRHTEIGYHIALSSVDLMPIANWVLKHHEHWNGNGYPLGLKEENIPLECRILSVVDAYDAMTNDRPYRNAMPKEDAMRELKAYSGTQFDPQVVSAFILMMDDAYSNS